MERAVERNRMGAFCLRGATFWKVFGEGLGAGNVTAFSLWGWALGKEGRAPLGRNLCGGVARVASLGMATSLTRMSVSDLRNVRREF